MEILSEFGFDLRLFVAQILNFLILAFLFKKFLYKPLLGAVKKREEEIRRGISNAEKAEKALLSAEEKKDEVLNKAAKEAEGIINESRKSAQLESERIILETRAESERIIKNAKEQANLEKEAIEKQISSIAIDASQKILNSVIAELFTGKEKDEILKRGVKKIKAL